MNTDQLKVLIIEDDRDIRDLMFFQLQADGLKVSKATSGDEGKFKIDNEDFDIFIIDWMLPGITGLELIQYLKAKAQTKKKAIVMVTALTQPENIIKGLDAGADDYITKPFDMSVFQARVRAQARRLSASTVTEIVEAPNFLLNIPKVQVLVEGVEVQLTSTEFKILSILAQTPGRVHTRENLINNIQGDSIYVTTRTVDTHIAGLRKKLGTCSDLVETIRGVGYRFKEI